jgi:hypothetical protein
MTDLCFGFTCGAAGTGFTKASPSEPSRLMPSGPWAGDIDLPTCQSHDPVNGAPRVLVLLEALLRGSGSFAKVCQASVALTLGWEETLVILIHPCQGLRRVWEGLGDHLYKVAAPMHLDPTTATNIPTFFRYALSILPPGRPRCDGLGCGPPAWSVSPHLFEGFKLTLASPVEQTTPPPVSRLVLRAVSKLRSSLWDAPRPPTTPASAPMITLPRSLPA